MPNLDQIGRKLAQLGGLGPFKFEKVLPARAGSIKKRSDPQRESNREPARIQQGATREHTFGINCPQCPSKKI